jgi:hypothetical protein
MKLDLRIGNASSIRKIKLKVYQHTIIIFQERSLDNSAAYKYKNQFTQKGEQNTIFIFNIIGFISCNVQ